MKNATHGKIAFPMVNSKLFRVIRNSKHGVSPDEDSQHYNLTLFSTENIFS